MTMTIRKIGILAAVWVAAGLLGGCDENMSLKGANQGNPFQNLGAKPKPKTTEPAKADYVQDETVIQQDGESSRGATDVAMEWADKYAKVAQELLYANKRIADLEKEKKLSQESIATLKAELAGYQRELSDANAMLNDMKRDLKEWRQNVLGIRRDFMASQNAILVSQQKILELLGGEMSRGGFQRTVSPAPAGPVSKASSADENLAQTQAEIE